MRELDSTGMRELDSNTRTADEHAPSPASDEQRRERLAALLATFPERRVVVLGDMLADQFVYGEITRVSREAPVFILRHEQTQTVAGGAANCAANLAALGAQVSLIGIVGEDEAGRALLEYLAAAGVDTSHVIRLRGTATTTKVRILAGQAHSTRQQVIRVDYEGGAHDAARVCAQFEASRQLFRETDAVVVSDYNYGVASAEAIECVREILRERAEEVPMLVDSRFRLTDFSHFTSATPNEDEVEHLAGRRLTTPAELEEAGRQLRARLGSRSLLITRGSQGMLLIEAEGEPLYIEAVGNRDAVDVTGAGDTVMAAYTLAIASGATHREAAHLANHAGGIVVMKRGTATVAAEELLASLMHGDEL